MADIANASSTSDTARAWLWVIEYCASVKEIDSETLHALIDAAPRFPKELGKKTMEVVALRCLEDLFSTSDKCMNEGCFGPEEKVSFDFSLSCEDVLHSILQEMSSSDLSKDGKELLKWDIQPFIMHKRASMPKCALKQLKDAILEGIHPCIAILKERSGLVHRDDVDRPFVRNVVASGVDDTAVQNMASIENLFPVPHENDAAGGDDSHDRNLLPRKRDRIELANEMEDHHENNDANKLDSEAEKLRKDGLFTEQSMDHILASKCGKELVEDDSERMAEDNGKDDFSVEIEPQLGQLEESRSTDNVRSDSVVIAGIGQSPDAGDESGHNVCETEINGNRVEPISGGPPQQHILADKTNNVEDRMLDGECNARTEQDAFIVEAKKSSDLGNQLKSSTVASFDGFHGKVNLEEPESKGEGDKDHISEDDTSSDDEEYNHGRVDASDDEGDNHERVDVSLKKNQFLSSQCPWGDDSFSMSYWTEQNLCVRCKKDGQLLVCSIPGCPLVIHENCLGAPAKFDDKGDFYCPFCAYSLAISEYVECKKKTSLVRKQLALMFQHPAKLAGGKDHHDPSRRTKESLGKRKRRAHEIQKKTSKPQIVDSSEAPVFAVHIDGETSSDKKGNSLISNYSIRVRKRDNHYTDPAFPVLRRKKVPWTAKEEEMLKEGVEKLSGGNDRCIPWKKILEYGGTVFQPGRRTAIDLKDKWRNMCKS